jgi:cytochrome c5
LILVVTVFSAGACNGSGRGDDAAPVREPGGRGADRGMMRGMMDRMMANMPEGVPASALPDPGSRGARLVARYCSQCHGIPSPARQSAEDWEPTVRRMVDRMARMARMPMHRIEVPSDEEEQVILAYLQAHALRAADPAELPDGGPGARLFAEACSRCHALPDPVQHTPEEWPAVVARMRRHMREMGVAEVTDAQAAAIVAYLQRAARR